MVLHDSLPEHVGGSEVHAHRVARELVRRGHRVASVFTERRPGVGAGEVREDRLDGVETFEIARPADEPEIVGLQPTPEVRDALRGVLRNFDPQVVHVHHTRAFGPGVIADARSLGARVLWTLHDASLLCPGAELRRTDGSDCDPIEAAKGPCGACPGRETLGGSEGTSQLGKPGTWSQAHASALGRTNGCEVPSRFLAAHLRASGLRGTEHLGVRATGVPGERRGPRTCPRGTPLRVGFVGGLYPSKGAHVLARAIAGLPSDSIELHVFGVREWFPDYVRSLEESAGDGGRAARLRIHGRFHPDRAENEVYGKIDLLAVPSLWCENRPLNLLEARRLGVPVLGSRVGGIEELVTDGVDGGLVAPGDVGAWRARLLSLSAERDALDRWARAAEPPRTLADEVDGLESWYRGDP